MNRRDLLRTVGTIGGWALVARPLEAVQAATDADARMGILIDTTKCLGCRMCERACAAANDLPEPTAPVDRTAYRPTSPTQFTAVNRYETSTGTTMVKRQCMHCLQPACVSACLTRAMHRSPQGPVSWQSDRCMGCRFCMVSCPFDIPKFEYDSPVPRIRKCEMCRERLAAGQQPACVAACPAKALTFGPRSELLHLARTRIYGEPGKYTPHIYGEHEAGGTSVLYLAAVPFAELGFRTDLGSAAYPTFTREFLYAVPVVLTLVPPFLLAVAMARREQAVRAHEQAEEDVR